MPAPHPPEFRQRAVELARQGSTPVSKIAKDLGISDSCLRNWMHQADADDNRGGDRLSGSDRSRRSRSCSARRPTRVLTVFGASRRSCAASATQMPGREAISRSSSPPA